MKITALLCVSVVLAGIYEYIHRKRTAGDKRPGLAAAEQIFFWILTVMLVMFNITRTRFNDTYFYLHSFDLSPSLDEVSSISMIPGDNPVFNFIQIIIRTLTDEGQWLLIVFGTATIVLYMLFFKKYAKYFTFTVFLFIAMECYIFTLAAIKQVFATALCLWAVHFALKRQWIPYAVLIVLGAEAHTFSLIFLLVPLFMVKPWTVRSYISLSVSMAFCLTFNLFADAVAVLMEVTQEGYTVTEIAGGGVNIFRILAFAVPPLLSLIFYNDIYENADDADCLFSNITLLTFCILAVGAFGDANLFARLAAYFTPIVVTVLPVMLMRIKQRVKYFLTYGCVTGFFVFFYYGHFIAQSYDTELAQLGLGEFFRLIF